MTLLVAFALIIGTVLIATVIDLFRTDRGDRLCTTCKGIGSVRVGYGGPNYRRCLACGGRGRVAK